MMITILIASILFNVCESPRRRSVVPDDFIGVGQLYQMLKSLLSVAHFDFDEADFEDLPTRPPLLHNTKF